jgi:hypothetical protein
MRLVLKSSEDSFGLLMDICVFKTVDRYATAVIDAYLQENQGMLQFFPEDFDIDGHYVVKNGNLVSDYKEILNAFKNLSADSLSFIGDSVVIECNVEKRLLSISWEMVLSY